MYCSAQTNFIHSVFRLDEVNQGMSMFVEQWKQMVRDDDAFNSVPWVLHVKAFWVMQHVKAFY